MKNILFCILIVSILSCKKQAKKNSILKNPITQIQFIDSFSNKLKLDTARYITKADFYPMYIGNSADSIILTYNTENLKNRTINRRSNKIPDSTDLNIYVDTLKTIGSVRRSFIPPPPAPNSKGEIYQINKGRGGTKSYPVIIENKSINTLRIGYGDYIPLLIEAIDSLGNWRPIQKPYVYFCGTGLTHYYLPPKEILITSCKLYKGEYKTKMRLVYGFNRTNYSNEFSGTINYNQFKESPNKYY